MAWASQETRYETIMFPICHRLQESVKPSVRNPYPLPQPAMWYPIVYGDLEEADNVEDLFVNPFLEEEG